MAKPVHYEAYALVGGGLLSALGITLAFRGYHREAAVLGVFGALFGAVVGVGKLISASSE